MNGSADATITSKRVTVTIFLDTVHLHAAEEPRGFHEQDADDEHERHGELELVADDEGADPVPGPAGQKPPDDRAPRVVDAADERGGEGIEEHAAHHVGIEV